MTEALSIGDSRDLVRKIFSRYLNDERRYDAWGAQGKVLVLREILAEEGFDIRQLAAIGIQFQKLVNLVFPRTFLSQSKTGNISGMERRFAEYYKEVKLNLTLQGLEDNITESEALEETASKFAVDIVQLKNILKSATIN